MTAVDSAVADVHRLHRRLAERPDLRPGPPVDDLFGSLVRLVVAAPPAAERGVADDPSVRPLRAPLQRLCAAGERELELAWAHRIAASGDAAAELARFPYAANYRRLARLEVDAVAATAGRPVRRAAFVGAGPLPLSALLLADLLGAPVDAIDRDPEAVAAATAVVAALGADPGGAGDPPGGPDRPRRPGGPDRVGALDRSGAGARPGGAGRPEVRVVAAAADAVDLSGHDLVVLAALVGDTPAGKGAVLEALAAAMAPGATLVARSARGARTLLYPALEVPAVARAGGGRFVPQAVIHPVDDVVNSVVVARVRGGA